MNVYLHRVQMEPALTAAFRILVHVMMAIRMLTARPTLMNATLAHVLLRVIVLMPLMDIHAPVRVVSSVLTAALR